MEKISCKAYKELSTFIKEEEIFLKDLKELYSKYDINGNAEEDVNIMLKSLIGRDAFPETKTVIERLKSKYKVCIGSNTDTEPFLKNLDKNNIIVDGYFTSESMQIYKVYWIDSEVK